MKKRFYGTGFMIAVLVMGILLFASGFVLRRTILKDIPQYGDAPDIALPFLLLQDSSPVAQAREREAWEKAQLAEEGPALEAFAATDAPSTVQPEVTELMPGLMVRVTETPLATATPVPEPTESMIQLVEAAPTATPEPFWDDMPTLEPLEIVENPWRPATEEDFAHTLFVGDSKTDGLRMWARIGEAEYFCGTSYSVYNILNKRTSDNNFSDWTLEGLLSRRSYDTIYVMLGYNEAGYALDSLIKQYTYLLSVIHKAQPDARLVLYGLMHASRNVARKYSYYSVSNLENINQALDELASQWDFIDYMPCTTAFYDEDGYLLSNVSSDGEHLKPDYVREWAKDILEHAIVR